MNLATILPINFDRGFILGFILGVSFSILMLIVFPPVCPVEKIVSSLILK